MRNSFDNSIRMSLVANRRTSLVSRHNSLVEAAVTEKLTQNMDPRMKPKIMFPPKFINYSCF